MSKARETAREFLARCDQLGWVPNVRGSIVEISKGITPGDNSSFCRADSEYYEILEVIPRTSAGSTWGTTGDTVGALSAMRTGLYRVKMSGGSKRVLSAIAKEQGLI